jgi:hypothetical protein
MPGSVASGTLCISKFLLEISAIAYPASLFMGIVALEILA